MAEAQAEVERLQGLVSLYDDLEKVGLDAILHTGMTAVALPLEGVELGAKGLKKGLELIEVALLALDDALPSARESILWAEDKVDDLASGVARLESALTRALEKAEGNPVVQAIKDFISMVLDNLPFGLGTKVRDVLEGLAGIVTGVDDLIGDINENLFEPMRENWFADDGRAGITASLINPLIEHILDPLEAHLGNLGEMVDNWQHKLMAPTQVALEERATLQESIEAYKIRHRIGAE